MGEAAINAKDDYVRPELPSRPESDDAGDDPDYRRGRRRDFDLTRQSIQDTEHLRILSILYYVFGGLAAFGGFFPLIYVFIGAMFVSGGMPGGPGAPPPALGWIFIAFGGGFSLFIWIVAACCLFAGYNLGHKKRYILCFVVACLCCIQIPLGTVLGVFTIVVLARPSVKDLFAGASSEAPHAEEE